MPAPRGVYPVEKAICISSKSASEWRHFPLVFRWGERLCSAAADPVSATNNEERIEMKKIIALMALVAFACTASANCGSCDAKSEKPKVECKKCSGKECAEACKCKCHKPEKEKKKAE